MKADWLTNDAGSTSCIYYKISQDDATLTNAGVYSAGELFVEKVSDEDGHMMYTFTNKMGEKVLERMMNGSDKNDTYYVYDDFGNLRFVLPPAIVSDISQTSLNNFAYIYKYDERNRCIEKKTTWM